MSKFKIVRFKVAIDDLFQKSVNQKHKNKFFLLICNKNLFKFLIKIQLERKSLSDVCAKTKISWELKQSSKKKTFFLAKMENFVELTTNLYEILHICGRNCARNFLNFFYIIVSSVFFLSSDSRASFPNKQKFQKSLRALVIFVKGKARMWKTTFRSIPSSLRR